MTMQHVPDDFEDKLAVFEGELPVAIEATAVGAITKSEVEAQLSAAHRYPRSIGKFVREAATLATMSQDIAESCIYSLPRAGKQITGPSVRLAEIVASAYGNLHYGSRIVEEGERDLTAQGVAWDLERNVRVTVETKRRITNKNGRRYDDDMVIVTGNAAASIAIRNAIFRVIPKSYVQAVYEAARKVAVGDAKTLETKRLTVIERFEKLGVNRERVLLRIGKSTVEDIGLEDLELLIGLGTAIRDGAQRIEEVFPVAAPAPVAPENDGKRMSIGKGGKKAASDDGEREPGSDDR